jgi:hypothetical protein
MTDETPDLWVDLFGRCLVCGQDCITGGCTNPSCSRGSRVRCYLIYLDGRLVEVNPKP